MLRLCRRFVGQNRTPGIPDRARFFKKNTMSQPIFRLFILLFWVATIQSLRAQDQATVFSESEFTRLITYLEGEDWKPALALSDSILQRFPAQDTGFSEASLIRYAHLKSVAGLLAQKDLDLADAEKKAKRHLGNWLVHPSHPVRDERCLFNCVTLDKEKPNTLSICAANRNATEIHMFESVHLDFPFTQDDIKELAGKFVRVGGQLKSVKAEGSAMWRFRVEYEHGELFIE